MAKRFRPQLSAFLVESFWPAETSGIGRFAFCTTVRSLELAYSSSPRLRRPQSGICEQGRDLPVEGLDFHIQDLVASLLAEEQQQLVAGIDDQAARLGFSFPGCLSIRFGLAPKCSS